MSLTAMLTPYLVNQLGNGDVAQVNISIRLSLESVLFLYYVNISYVI